MTPEDLKLCYQTILNTDDGKIVLDDLARRFHVVGPVFSSDPYETAFRDGQRCVVLWLNRQLQEVKAPDQETGE